MAKQGIKDANLARFKKKRMITYLTAIALVLLGVGVTYAIVFYQGGSDNNLINSGHISMSYTEPSNAYVLDNALPIEDEAAIATGHGFEFQVMSHATTNENDHDGIEIPYEITLSKIDIDQGKELLPENMIRIYLINNDTKRVLLGPVPLSEVDNSIVYTDSKSLLQTINTHKEGEGPITTSYKLIAWLDKDFVIENNSEKSYQYKFKININSNVKSLDLKDKVAPVLNVTSKGLDVTIKATDEFGITNYAITESADRPYVWNDIESTKDLNKLVTMDEYKTYYVHVRDGSNNVTSKPIVVKVWDDQPPKVMLNVTKGNQEAQIAADISDNKDIAAYQITKNSTPSDTDWVVADKKTKATPSFKETEAGTYYVFAKDESGNVGQEQVTLKYVEDDTCDCNKTATKRETYGCNVSYSYDCSYTENYDCSYTENYDCNPYKCNPHKVKNVDYRNGKEVVVWDTVYDTCYKTCSRTVPKTCSRNVPDTCYGSSWDPSGCSRNVEYCEKHNACMLTN